MPPLALNVGFQGDSVAKLQKWLAAFFSRKEIPSENRHMFSSALPKLPVGSSLVAVVPRTIFRSPRPQPGKFVFNDPKRVLQHYQGQSRSNADITEPSL
jgi:hypothetical protein